MKSHDIKTFCWKNGVTIYPVNIRGVWYIEAKTAKKRHTYKQKELGRGNTIKMTLKINERINNCYMHWYKKLNTKT